MLETPTKALLHEDLTGRIIAAAVKVHSALGPGLLESVYETCLAHELTRAEFTIQRQVDVPIVYEGIRLESGFRADLIVNKLVIVELKAIDKTAPIHEAQLMTYLRLSDIRVGLLINFNQVRVTDNLLRRVL